MRKDALCLLALAWLAAPALADPAGQLAGAVKEKSRLSLSAIDAGDHSIFRATVKHPIGEYFLVFASANPKLGLGEWVGTGIVGGAGAGDAYFAVPPASTFPKGVEISFRAAVTTPMGFDWTDWVEFGMNPNCERLSFNYGADSNPLAPGTILSDQWASANLQVSAVSNSGGGTDQVIIFDSSNPTGGDFDLQTPGYGPNNDTGLGNLLIVAADVVDADMDGLVDDPDDDENGGTIILEFDRPVAMCKLALVDLDKGGIGSTITFFDPSNAELDTLALPSLGDNSYEEVSFYYENVSRVEIFFVGSGGIPFMELIPCPSVLDFDSNTMGTPINLEEGTIIDGSFQTAAEVMAINAHPMHPDELLLFDTQDPTGGDDDLQTPGPGIGNDQPLGKVLIISENVGDGNSDGIVDDPDDEAWGGVMVFDFSIDMTFESATVIDVDENETSFFELKDEGGATLATIPLASLGNNSVQTVSQVVSGVRTVELHLGGSGALARLQVCPEFE